jgi:DNA polymerase-3 subunit beta
MQVTVLQNNLARGLSIVRRAVAARSTLQVLSNILLSTDEGRLKLAATNLELGITCWVGAKVEEEGSITVPANTLADLVGTLPPDRIDMTLSVSTQTLRLVCGSTTANIKGISAEEFPLMPEAGDTAAVRVPAEALREMIQQTAFAAAADSSRPILTGVQTQFEDNRLTLAAADGFRLAVRTAELPGAVAEPTSLIIPARALTEVARVSADDESEIGLTTPPERGQVLFHMENIDVVSQLVDGNFPDYEQIIPRSYATRTVVHTAEFLRACKRAEIFARESANTVRLHIQPGENDLTPGVLTVHATSQETGDNQVVVTASIEGSELEIAFNVRYLIDALNIITTEQVALETNTPSNPGVLRPVGRDDYLYVIMPMHIGR